MYYYHNPYLNPFTNYGMDYAPATRYIDNNHRFRKNNLAANSHKSSFSKQEAAAIALLLGIDFSKSPFDLEAFWKGVNVELEHGRRSLLTDVTGDDPLLTGKIAWAHLNEFPDYYKRLKVLEDEAKAYWKRN